MPGAPNRPPEKPVEVPVAPPVPETPAQRALRRLAPSRVALLLEIWKGSPSPELTVPYARAEAAFAAGDYEDAVSALDLLSIRFAEPRWPSFPEPFRRLRVAIPTPVPPHWDPEHGLAPGEREARRAHRAAEDQLALADGTLAWAAAHGVEIGEFAPRLAAARTELGTSGVSVAVYEAIDAFWRAVRERLPDPVGRARAAPSATAAPEPVGDA